MIKYKIFNIREQIFTGKKTKWLKDDVWEWKYPTWNSSHIEFYNDVAKFIDSIELVSLSTVSSTYFIIWYKDKI